MECVIKQKHENNLRGEIEMEEQMYLRHLQWQHSIEMSKRYLV